MTSERYADVHMQRKYSMMRWGVATGTVISGIIIIITGVVIFTAQDLGPTELRSLTIGLGTTSLVIVVLMVVAYIAIEIMRKREMDRILERQELTYRTVQRDIEIVTRPTAPPPTVRVSSRTSSPPSYVTSPSSGVSSPPSYATQDYHSASFWHARSTAPSGNR